MMKNLLALLILYSLAGCALEPVPVVQVADKRDVLTVHDDGTMKFRDRLLNKKDVVIYPDGFGGERAAVKMHVPLKDSEFYRDSITVHRIDADTAVIQN